MITYSVKFAINKTTKNQNSGILLWVDYNICEICNEQSHKDSKLRYFTLSLNDYNLWEIGYERRNKESKLRYFTLSLDDYILYEICNEQMHKESKLKHFTLSLDYSILLKFTLNKCTKNLNWDISHWV